MKDFFQRATNTVAAIQHINDFYQKIFFTAVPDVDDSFSDVTIPTYLLQLLPAENDDATSQFSEKMEFDVQLISFDKKITLHLLWKEIKGIIRRAVNNDDDIIIICDDRHRFTNEYSKSFLINNIIRAHELGAACLLGGASNCECAISVTENLFWVKSFDTTHFIVLYKKIFNEILTINDCRRSNPLTLLSQITSNKMLLYPFLSTPSEVGTNQKKNYTNKQIIKKSFEEASRYLKIILEATKRYQSQ